MDPTPTPPAPLTPQQAAIQDVRARYERGEISFEQFHRALDALVLAHDEEDCAAILRELPPSPLTALSGLDRPATAVPTDVPAGRQQWIVAVMSQTRKVRNRWQLAPNAHSLALMGEIKLDLTAADLPSRARLRLVAIMGTVVVYVPRNVRVTVRSTAVLGDAIALGESTSGVLAFGHEAHTPSSEPVVAELEIEALAVMSSVKVALVDGAAAGAGAIVREVVRSAIEGARRGWEQGDSSRSVLGADANRAP